MAQGPEKGRQARRVEPIATGGRCRHGMLVELYERVRDGVREIFARIDCGVCARNYPDLINGVEYAGAA